MSAYSKPLSSAYTYELARHMERCQGLSGVTKRDFFRFFWAVWDRTFKPPAILKAFNVTGISPLNPEVILKKFKPAVTERPSSSGSSSSVLSASDWRKIEDLLRQVVADVYDRRAQKLSETVQKLTAQKALADYENKGLKEAFINEKKKRQRNKPLLLEAPQEYNGGAVFWSLGKVSDARARQAQKDADDVEKKAPKGRPYRAEEGGKTGKSRPT